MEEPAMSDFNTTSFNQENAGIPDVELAVSSAA
jgi:hypothetical protein